MRPKRLVYLRMLIALVVSSLVMLGCAEARTGVDVLSFTAVVGSAPAATATATLASVTPTTSGSIPTITPTGGGPRAPAQDRGPLLFTAAAVMVVALGMLALVALVGFLYWFTRR